MRVERSDAPTRSDVDESKEHFDVAPGGGVTVAQALTELANGAVLVDVRTPSEYRHGHAFPAIHIQLGWLATDVPVQAPGRTIITICSFGNRASQAAAQLVSDGVRAFYITGGLSAWREAGQLVVRA